MGAISLQRLGSACPRPAALFNDRVQHEARLFWQLILQAELIQSCLPISSLWVCPVCSLASAPTQELAPIAGSVVLLPQIVPALRNVNAKRPLTQRHADPYAWDLPGVRGMLERFLAAAGATSIPPVEEYTQLPDKVIWSLS